MHTHSKGGDPQHDGDKAEDVKHQHDDIVVMSSLHRRV